MHNISDCKISTGIVMQFDIANIRSCFFKNRRFDDLDYRNNCPVPGQHSALFIALTANVQFKKRENSTQAYNMSFSHNKKHACAPKPPLSFERIDAKTANTEIISFYCRPFVCECVCSVLATVPLRPPSPFTSCQMLP